MSGGSVPAGDDPFAAVDDILSGWRQVLKTDYEAYRNHVKRVILFVQWLDTNHAVATTGLIVAAVFHDLGIWTDGTLDYLDPSVRLARQYWVENGLAEESFEDVAAMIAWHHKLTRCDQSIACELFRRADLVDLTHGVIRFGLPRARVQRAYALFPDCGFHRFLAGALSRYAIRHPWKPLPMVRI